MRRPSAGCERSALRPRNGRNLRTGWERCKKSRTEPPASGRKQHREKERLTRIRRNLSALGRRAAALRELETLQKVPDLAEDTAEQRITALEEQRAAQSTVRSAQRKIAELEQALAGLVIPSGYLDQGLQIEALHQRLSGYREALNNLPLIEARHHSLREQAQAILAEIAPGLSLEQADRLRPTQETQVRIRHLMEEQIRLSGELGHLREQQRESQAHLEQIKRRLAQHSELQEITPLEAVIDAVSARGDLEGELGGVGQEREVLRQEVDGELASLGGGEAEALERLPVPARATLERYEQKLTGLAEKRRSIEQDIKRLSEDRNRLSADLAELEAGGGIPGEALKSQIASDEGEICKLRAREQDAERKLIGWQNQWGLALQPLSLTPEAFPVEVEARLASLASLFGALDEAKRREQEIEAMGRTRDSFSAEVKNLCRRSAPELLSQEELAACEAIYQRYQQAKRDSQKREQTEARLQEEKARACEELVKIQDSQARLEALCARAGCADPSELPELERQASRKRELEKEVRGLERALEEQNGLPLQELLGEAAAEDPDSLPGRIAELEQSVGSLDERRLQLIRAAADLEGELRQVDGSSEAAVAQQQTVEALARIRNATEEYARLRITAALLRQTIERYRERNQGPILKRAGEIFVALTCGAFAGLDTGLDDENMILVGRRNNRERVRVEGMSEGTVDQLYLALRLVAIDRYLEANEPIPLSVDDLLIQFDDPRSRATFKVLETLGARTNRTFIKCINYAAIGKPY